MMNGGTDEQERDLRSGVSGKTAIDVEALNVVRRNAGCIPQSPSEGFAFRPGEISDADQDFDLTV